MASVTKNTLLDAISADEYGPFAGLTNIEKKKFIDLFFGQIATLAGQGSVKVKRLGRFELQIKEARPGRNPRNPDEYHEIAARARVRLVPSPLFRDRCGKGDLKCKNR